MPIRGGMRKRSKRWHEEMGHTLAQNKVACHEDEVIWHEIVLITTRLANSMSIHQMTPTKIIVARLTTLRDESVTADM